MPHWKTNSSSWKLTIDWWRSFFSFAEMDVWQQLFRCQQNKFLRRTDWGVASPGPDTRPVWRSCCTDEVPTCKKWKWSGNISHMQQEYRWLDALHHNSVQIISSARQSRSSAVSETCFCVSAAMLQLCRPIATSCVQHLYRNCTNYSNLKTRLIKTFGSKKKENGATSLQT